MRNFAISSVACAAFLAGHSQAALLISESFNYGTGAISGTTTGGSGLTGTYSAGGVNANGSNATFNVSASSLSFAGHFAASGGSLTVANAGGNYGEAAASAQISASLAGNTKVFSSSLERLNTAGQYFNDWTVEQRFNSAVLGNYQSSGGRNEVSAFGSGSASARRAGASMDASEVTDASKTLAAGTTYLLVTAYTLSGSNLTSATMYAFDQASYANYLTAANAAPANAEALLSSNALFSITDTANFAVSNVKYLQFSIGGGPSGQFDDYRLGTAVTDVVNVATPEPASLAILGCSASLIVMRRRRR